MSNFILVCIIVMCIVYLKITYDAIISRICMKKLFDKDLTSEQNTRKRICEHIYHMWLSLTLVAIIVLLCIFIRQFYSYY